MLPRFLVRMIRPVPGTWRDSTSPTVPGWVHAKTVALWRTLPGVTPPTEFTMYGETWEWRQSRTATDWVRDCASSLQRQVWLQGLERVARQQHRLAKSSPMYRHITLPEMRDALRTLTSGRMVHIHLDVGSDAQREPWDHRISAEFRHILAQAARGLETDAFRRDGEVVLTDSNGVRVGVALYTAQEVA